jgi:hypothetical protein
VLQMRMGMRMRMLLAGELLLGNPVLLESVLVRLESIRVLLVNAMGGNRAALHTFNFPNRNSNLYHDKFARVVLTGVFIMRPGKIILEGGANIVKSEKEHWLDG